jgi:hypothetical protein
MPNSNGAHIPVDIKAAGLALLITGMPCRQVQKALGQLFPDKPAPHYSTISRWLRYSPSNRAIAEDRWWETVFRVSELLHERMESPRLPIDELLTIMERTHEFIDRHWDRFSGQQDATNTPKTKSCCQKPTPTETKFSPSLRA